jgi:hypothetical protein
VHGHGLCSGPAAKCHFCDGKGEVPASVAAEGGSVRPFDRDTR